MRLIILSLAACLNIQLVCSQKILQTVSDGVCDCIGKERDKGNIKDPQTLYTICIGRTMMKFQNEIKKELGIDISDTSILNIKKAHDFGFQIGGSLAMGCSNYISLINEISIAKNGVKYFALAEKNMDGGLYDEAIKNYTQAIKIDPTNYDYFISRGIAYDKIKDYYKAITDYTRASEIKPTDYLAYFNSAVSKNNMNDFKGALFDIDKAILLDSFSCESQNAKGCILRDLNEYDKSITSLEKAYNCNSTNPTYSADIGYVYLCKKNYNMALEWFNKSLSFGLSNYIYGYIGNCYDYLGDYPKAIEFYSKEIKRDSMSYEAYYSRAGIYNRNQDYNRALSDYLSASCIDSTAAKSVFYTAMEYQHLKNSEKAESYFIKAQSMKDWDAGFYNLRGAFYESIKKYDLAIKDYLVSLSLVSDDCKTWLSIGKTYLCLENKVKAKEAFHKSAALGCTVAKVFIKK